MLAAATAITTSVAAGTAGIASSTSPVTDATTFVAERQKLNEFCCRHLRYTQHLSLPTFCLLVVVVQSPSRVQLLEIPWTVARQASLSFTISQSLPRFMFIELVMPSNHLILCCPLLFLSSVFCNIRVFSDESALCIRWPKYWSFSFTSILLMSIQG